MAKVTGLGGVFYVVEDPAATRAWYRDVLGIDGEYGPQLDWSEETGDKPYSLISHFPDDQYVKPGRGGFMINLRVDDLDAVLAPFRAAGEEVITKKEWDDPSVGRFARVHDPEGNPIELWEPPA